MYIGYARISAIEPIEQLEIQIQKLEGSGVASTRIYIDEGSSSESARTGYQNCLMALRTGDTLTVTSLDRLGLSATKLDRTVSLLFEDAIDLRVLSLEPCGTVAPEQLARTLRLLAETDQRLNSERTKIGLTRARHAGRKGGRRRSLSVRQVLGAQRRLQQQTHRVADVCRQYRISQSTLYRYMDSHGVLKDSGRRVVDGG
jgi:DNA invertase Pin-like site-specific DNA recombinase